MQSTVGIPSRCLIITVRVHSISSLVYLCLSSLHQKMLKWKPILHASVLHELYRHVIFYNNTNNINNENCTKNLWNQTNQKIYKSIYALKQQNEKKSTNEIHEIVVKVPQKKNMREKFLGPMGFKARKKAIALIINTIQYSAIGSKCSIYSVLIHT